MFNLHLKGKGETMMKTIKTSGAPAPGGDPGWWRRRVEWLWRHWNVRLTRAALARLAWFWTSATALMGLLAVGTVNGWTMLAAASVWITGAYLLHDVVAALPGEEDN